MKAALSFYSWFTNKDPKFLTLVGLRLVVPLSVI